MKFTFVHCLSDTYINTSLAHSSKDAFLIVMGHKFLLNVSSPMLFSEFLSGPSARHCISALRASGEQDTVPGFELLTGCGEGQVRPGNRGA